MSESRTKRVRVKKIRFANSPYEYHGNHYSFALLSAPDADGVVSQATSLRGCKDYLQDSIQKNLRGKPFDVYGYGYGTKSPIIGDTIKLRLLVRYNSGSPKKKMLATRDFLRLAERELKISPRTTATLVSPLLDTNIFVDGSPYLKTSKAATSAKKSAMFTASRAWIKSPTMISLYSLLIRLSHHHKPGEEFFPCLERILAEGQYSTDITYLRNSIDGIRYLVMMGHRKVFGNNKDLIKHYPATTQLHGHGIVYFSRQKENVITAKLKARQAAAIEPQSEG